MYKTRVIADSISPSGKRITTFELTYPRFVHSELLTHRFLSKNSASSRAIPVKKMLDQIRNDPAMPVFWGKNQAGMQAAEELEDFVGTDVTPWGDDWISPRDKAKRTWLEARDSAVGFAEKLMEIGLHKQIANRVTEPWMFITVLCTATEWENWYNLRDTKFAQPEIAWVAHDMREKHRTSEPILLEPGEWHLPLINEEDIEELWDQAYIKFPNNITDAVSRHPWVVEQLKLISTGRCARVSYLTHDGKRDLKEDIGLAEKLSQSGHWSPFEHVAQCLPDKTRVGNFIGWKQFRKEFENEHPTRVEAPYIEGSVTLTPDEAAVVLRVMKGSYSLDEEEADALDRACDKLQG